MRALSFMLLATLVAACERPSTTALLERGTWVDLSYPFDSTTIYWPTARPFRLEVVSAQRTPAGLYYAANNFSAAEHGGTHLDSPVHFAEGRNTTDRIPITQLMGPAVVVDVTTQTAADPDYRVMPSDLATWEQVHGRMPGGAVMLIRTGWGSRWPDRARYLGTATTGTAAVAELHFPGIDSSTARWLVERGGVDAVGIDTPSIDFGQSTTFDTHQILFAADIPALENVANLDRLPATGAYVIALPMKIGGGSGGPLRMVALLP